MFILGFFSLLTCGEFLQDVCPGRELVTNGKFIVSTYLYSTKLLSCWVVCFLFLPLKGSLTSAETFSVFGLHCVPGIDQNLLVSSKVKHSPTLWLRHCTQSYWKKIKYIHFKKCTQMFVSRLFLNCQKPGNNPNVHKQMNE